MIRGVPLLDASRVLTYTQRVRKPSVKTVRHLLLGLIVVVLAAVAVNYLHTWYSRSRSVKKVFELLSSDTIRSAEQIEYSGFQNGVCRYRIHAERVIEVRQGKSLLQGIEVRDFNSDGSVNNEIHSRKAEYDPQKKTADFSGDVKLLLGGRTELLTESLHYDLGSGVGKTHDSLRIRSDELRGSARGVVFDNVKRSLHLQSNVDLVLIQEKESAGIHAVADTAYLSRAENRCVFTGSARIEVDGRKLSGDLVEVLLEPGKNRVTSLIATGNAVYDSAEKEQSRTMAGDRMVFAVSETGSLEKISVSGQASFVAHSASEEQQLRAGSIDMDFGAEGRPARIAGRTSVTFQMKRGKTATSLAGESLDVRFSPGTGNLSSVDAAALAARPAAMVVENPSSGQRNELSAEAIRIGFRESGGQATLEKIRAEGSARYLSNPAARSLTAAMLEFVYSKEGDFLDSGSASGKVVILERSGQSGEMRVRRLESDTAGFDFFPVNNQIRKLEASGNVHVTFEKKEKKGSAAKPSSIEEFQTYSDRMQAVFSLVKDRSEVSSMSQWGNFRYRDLSRSAQAGRCDYDGTRGRLALKESPGIVDDSISATGERIEFDQNEKLLSISGNVRSVLRSKGGNGSLFDSSESSAPAVVTSDEMQYWEDRQRAIYKGTVQLLSETQQLEAGHLEIISGGERIVAKESVRHFVPARKDRSGPSKKGSGKAVNSPILIRSSNLDYTKAKNALTYVGSVIVNSENVSLSAGTLDAILDKEGKNVERATARTSVLIRQAGKECKGDAAEWYLEPGKFVVTGTPAELNDPESGRSFARRLTSYTADDRILLENQ